MSQAAKILVVDDEDHICQMLRSLIEQYGYTCCVASDGVEGLAALRSGDFDVVITDLLMPKMDGFGLLIALREAGIEAVPVVLTACGEVSSAVEAMRLGAFDFLLKPVMDFTSLKRVVEKAVQHARVVRHSRAMEHLVAEWETTFDACPDLIAIWDMAYRVVRCNRALAERLGMSKADIVGAVCCEVLDGAKGTLDYCVCTRPLCDGTAHAEEVHSERLGGDFLITTTPLRGADGHLLGVVYIARDITERKQAEKALQKAHEETEQVLAAISSILIGVDEHDRITRWNATAEKVFGIPSAEAIGRTLSECGIQWNGGSILRRIAECRRKDCSTRLDDIRYTRPDGKEGLLGVTVTPIKGETGAPMGFLLLGAEITERRMLESQLAQAQKLESVGQLAAGIAHEINTPIQYVGDNARFLQDAFGDLQRLLEQYDRLLSSVKAGEVSPDLVADVEAAATEVDVAYLMEEIPAAVQQSLEGVERVANIVRAMKEFSHPGTEEKTAIDLNRAIESTLTVARNEWKYVADVVTDFDPNLPSVPCLPGDINQVFLNIIVNAVHAITDVAGDGSSGKGIITVSTRHDGDWVEVRISDTGTGIPEEVRDKIFDPFFTTKEVGKGTGQGLAISHSVVVDKHGGMITFETEMGRGTTFIIRLPLGSNLS